MRGLFGFEKKVAESPIVPDISSILTAKSRDAFARGDFQGASKFRKQQEYLEKNKKSGK